MIQFCRTVVITTYACAVAACAPTQARSIADLAAHDAGNPANMNQVAESYVKLALAVGSHDPDFVDAYYGPREWKSEADAATTPLSELGERARRLVDELGDEAEARGGELERLRHAYLRKQLESLSARIDMLGGKRFAFDEESRALYDAAAPVHTEEHFREILTQLERVLPGSGPVAARYESFRRAFVIPRAQLDTVFRSAVAACRERVMQHLTLPRAESFAIEYVSDKPWSAYNWYQGGYRSVIQVNTSLPVYIDRALDLACHEGYPGHHVYNVLLEKHLVRDRGWVEYSVYPLFSPQSLIAEGSANYGIQMAFPGAERVAFERSTLFPLAGLDPARAQEYSRVQELVRQLGYAGNEAARRYLNGQFDVATATDWLVRYALMTPAAAAQRVRFFDRYRSYVINYNLGEDLVARYVERRARSSEDERWRVFGELLSSPRLPSGL